MTRTVFLLSLAFVAALALARVADAQFPILDEVAGRVVQKVQQSSCEELWQSRGKPKSEREQEAIQLLREDPAMMSAFLAQVAAPVATKMFECGMIP